MRSARKEELNEWLDRVKRYGEAPAGDLGDEALSKYIALKYAREALDDPDSDAYTALFGADGVRTNPGPSFNTAEMNMVKRSLDATIDESEKALEAKYKEGTAQKSYDYLKQYFDPALSELVREGGAVATFVGDEILDRETTADQYMNQLYTKVYQHLDSAWESAGEVVSAVAAGNMEDLYNATTTLHNSLENAQLLTDQHTSIGGFSSLLGSEADYQMQVRADQLSGTFRLIAQDLEKMGYGGAKEARFKREADSILKLGDLTDDKNYRYPGPLLSAVIGFLVESEDLATANGGSNTRRRAVTSVVGHLATGEPSFLEIEEDLVDLVFNNHYFATGKIDKPGLRQLLDENITITSELSTVASVLKSAGYVSKGDVLEKVTKPLQARLEKKLKKLADESLKVSVQERLSGAGALIKEKTTQAAQGVGAIAGELQAARLSQKATSELRAAEKRKEAAERAQEAQLMEESLEPRDLQIKLSDDIKKLTDERNELTERIDATGLESEKKNLKARGRAIDQKLRALGEELARSIGGGSGE